MLVFGDTTASNQVVIRVTAIDVRCRYSALVEHSFVVCGLGKDLMAKP
jgi:hypothetical protein